MKVDRARLGRLDHRAAGRMSKRLHRRAFIADRVIFRRISARQRDAIEQPVVERYGCEGRCQGRGDREFVSTGPGLRDENRFLRDLTSGVIKSVVFGLVITAAGCQEGFSTGAGAEEVGRSTTSAVVVSIFLVILIDLVFTTLFYVARGGA